MTAQDAFTIRLYRKGDVWHAIATDDTTGEHAGGSMGLTGEDDSSIKDALECVGRCIRSYRAVR